MAGPTVSARTTFAVSIARPTTFDAAGFGALTYTQIRGIRQVGDLGRLYITVETNSIDYAVQYKRVAGRGSLSVDVELIRITDAGQTILAGATNSTTGYSYRIVGPDGAAIYFTAFLSRWLRGGFSATSVADYRGTLEIESDVVGL